MDLCGLLVINDIWIQFCLIWDYISNGDLYNYHQKAIGWVQNGIMGSMNQQYDVWVHWKT